MTPPADPRKMSLLPDRLYEVPRSQSDTSYEGLASKMLDKRGRRSSEWSAKDSKKIILRPLQLSEVKNSGLLYRRLSRTAADSTPNKTAVETTSGKTTKEKSGELGRSYSMRRVKKMDESRQRHRGSSIPSDASHCGAKVKERTISNRSLPLPGDESDYLRLRNFSVTSKGVINRGDSFRCKSGEDRRVVEAVKEAPSPLREDPKEEPLTPQSPAKKSYKVFLVGAPQVGKSALWHQFRTSEYICANDHLSSDQEMERVITVVLNNEETQLEFEEETLHGEHAFVSLKPECWDALAVVYSVTDRRSFQRAKHLLRQLEHVLDCRAVILVANKTDLVRLRSVSTEEGRSLAKDRGCKFIETSVGINHNVDELLVGTLSQVRIKERAADKLQRKRDSGWRHSLYSGCKASGVLKKILRRACLDSKSCDNLHVL